MEIQRSIRSISSTIRTLSGAITTFGLLSLSACGGAGTETAGADDAEDSLATQEQGLHSSAQSLPWRGAASDPVPMTSAEFGITGVVYSVDIGMTRVCTGGILGIGQTCHHELKGLQVWSYAPSNPNNFYTSGDHLGRSIIGKSTAGSWTRQTCPAGTVMSGYNIYARSTRVEKLGFSCRSLTSSTGQNLPDVGSTDILFGDLLRCGDYLGSLQVNFAGNGMGGGCVNK